jgi:hypothetical protein
MLILRHRVAIAGVIAVAAVAVPTAALATGSGAPSGKSSAPAVSASRSKSAVVPPAAAASQKAAAKQAQSHGGGPSIAPALATRLGVSTSAAQHAVAQLGALGRGGADPANPAFATIARDLGVSPSRLAAALVTAKQSLAGK